MTTPMRVRLTSRRLLRYVLAFALPFLVVAPVVASQSPAGASTANGTVYGAWPFTSTNKTGATCSLRLGSELSSTGAASQDWSWDATHRGIVWYLCDVVTVATHQYDGTATPVIAFKRIPYQSGAGWTSGGASSEPPLNRIGSVDPVPADGLYQTAPTVQVVQQKFLGSTSQWVRFSGRIEFSAGCQPGGTANGLCTAPAALGSYSNTHPNPVALQWCNPTVDLSTGQVASLQGLRILMSGDAYDAVCNIQGGSGVPSTNGNVPDNGAQGNGPGSCSVDALHVSVSGGAGFGTDVATDKYTYTLSSEPGHPSHSIKSTFELAAGETLRAAATVSWSGGGVPGVTLHVAQYPSYGGSSLFTTAMPLTTSGAVVQQDWTAPPYAKNPDGIVDELRMTKVYVVCSMSGQDKDQRTYVGPGDSDPQPYVPGAGGLVGDDPPTDECLLPVPCVNTGTGDQSPLNKAIACWSGFFYNVDFVGLATFPWVHISDFPGDAVCFAKEVTIGDGDDWTAEFGRVNARYTGSPIAALAAVVSLPWNATAAFTSAANTGDCHGLSLNMPQVTGTHFETTDVPIHPFEACDGGMATAASVVYYGLLISVWVGAFFFALRLVAKAVGFGPAAEVAQFEGGGGNVDTGAGFFNGPSSDGSFS